MRTVRVQLSWKHDDGGTPLVMHADNLDWSDLMEEWQGQPENKNKSKAGDDRTPPWRWLGCLYRDEKFVTIPAANIMKAMAEGGAQLTLKKQTTFKALTQSGLTITEIGWPLLIGGKPIPWEKVYRLRDDFLSFTDQKKRCAELGFDLLVKRAKIGMSKHVRVRPIFRECVAEGNIEILDEKISEANLLNILTFAGAYKGLGDWRPGSPKPGQYGRFGVKIL